jgi:hypothetical protein
VTILHTFKMTHADAKLGKPIVVRTARYWSRSDEVKRRPDRSQTPKVSPNYAALAEAGRRIGWVNAGFVREWDQTR